MAPTGSEALEWIAAGLALLPIVGSRRPGGEQTSHETKYGDPEEHGREACEQCQAEKGCLEPRAEEGILAPKTPDQRNEELEPQKNKKSGDE
jgi:hypothetical protein